jgi:hypothetical protein
MSTTASDVATTALSGGRVQLLINVGNSVAEAVTKYVMSLLGPEKRLELGAWIAVTINAIDNNFINPPKPDPKAEAAAKRQGPVYGYVATVASILNPLWIYGSYSLLAQQIIKRLEVPKQDLVLSGIMKRVEDAPETLVGTGESYPLEFARGLVDSTLPNATLPISVIQLAQALVLTVT